MAPNNEATRYVKVKEVGRGNNGQVHLALDKETGTRVAVKLIDRGHKVDSKIKAELMNHRRLLHHHVIQFKRAFLTEKHLCIVTEHAAGGTIKEFIKKQRNLTKEQARWLFQQLIVGLNYCHKMGINSRGIGLEHSLLDGHTSWPLLKISGFYYSKEKRDFDCTARGTVGTIQYMAPEVIMNGSFGSYDGEKADSWSAGVLLYYMTFGMYPFGSSSVKLSPVQKLRRTITDIMEERLEFPESVNIDDSLRALISKMLARDPSQRISIEEVMHHPWFQRDLPRGALEMNDNLLTQSNGIQSEEELKEILHKAQIPHYLELKY